MSTPIPIIRIPKEAVVEFDCVERADWSAGVQLEPLLEWINWVAERFRPKEIGKSSRSSEDFTPRTFRHYQTLGCIDSPERVGRGAVYRFRHYLQALLLRKLIWERVPSAQIARLMKGRSNEELKRLLFEGIEIVPGTASAPSQTASTQSTGRWVRHELAPGIEVHLAEGRPALDAKQMASAVSALKKLLGAG